MSDAILRIVYGRCGATIGSNGRIKSHPPIGGDTIGLAKIVFRDTIGTDCVSPPWHNTKTYCVHTIYVHNLANKYTIGVDHTTIRTDYVTGTIGRYVTVYRHLTTFLLCQGHNRIFLKWHNRFSGDTIGHLLCIFPFPVCSKILLHKQSRRGCNPHWEGRRHLSFLRIPDA